MCHLSQDQHFLICLHQSLIDLTMMNDFDPILSLVYWVQSKPVMCVRCSSPWWTCGGFKPSAISPRSVVFFLIGGGSVQRSNWIFWPAGGKMWMLEHHVSSLRARSCITSRELVRNAEGVRVQQLGEWKSTHWNFHLFYKIKCLIFKTSGKISSVVFFMFSGWCFNKSSSWF